MHVDYWGLRVNNFLLSKIMIVCLLVLFFALWLYYRVRFLHLHRETENAPLVDSRGVDADGATARFNYLFDHGEAETDSFAVHLCRALQLSKASEELGHVFASNTRPRILNVHHKEAVSIASLDAHRASRCEFERVFDKVHQNLFEPASITDELGQSSPVFLSIAGQLTQWSVCTGGQQGARVH